MANVIQKTWKKITNYEYDWKGFGLYAVNILMPLLVTIWWGYICWKLTSIRNTAGMTPLIWIILSTTKWISYVFGSFTALLTIGVIAWGWIYDRHNIEELVRCTQSVSGLVFCSNPITAIFTTIYLTAQLIVMSGFLVPCLLYKIKDARKARLASA